MTDPLDSLAFDDLTETDVPEDRRNMPPRVKRKRSYRNGGGFNAASVPWGKAGERERVVRQPEVPEWMRKPAKPPTRKT